MGRLGKDLRLGGLQEVGLLFCKVYQILQCARVSLQVRSEQVSQRLSHDDQRGMIVELRRARVACKSGRIRKPNDAATWSRSLSDICVPGPFSRGVDELV